MPAPKEPDSLVAQRDGDRFSLDPNSAEIMRNVNTPALEYAPDISGDGLELYFTRASEETGLRVMLARRDSGDTPLGCRARKPPSAALSKRLVFARPKRTLLP